MRTILRGLKTRSFLGWKFQTQIVERSHKADTRMHARRPRTLHRTTGPARLSKAITAVQAYAIPARMCLTVARSTSGSVSACTTSPVSTTRLTQQLNNTHRISSNILWSSLQPHVDASAPSAFARRSAISARFSARRTAARLSQWYAQYPAKPKPPIAITWPMGSVLWDAGEQGCEHGYRIFVRGVSEPGQVRQRVWDSHGQTEVRGYCAAGTR